MPPKPIETSIVYRNQAPNTDNPNTRKKSSNSPPTLLTRTPLPQQRSTRAHSVSDSAGSSSSARRVEALKKEGKKSSRLSFGSSTHTPYIERSGRIADSPDPIDLFEPHTPRLQTSQARAASSSSTLATPQRQDQPQLFAPDRRLRSGGPIPEPTTTVPAPIAPVAAAVIPVRAQTPTYAPDRLLRSRGPLPTPEPAPPTPAPGAVTAATIGTAPLPTPRALRSSGPVSEVATPAGTPQPKAKSTKPRLSTTTPAVHAQHSSDTSKAPLDVIDQPRSSRSRPTRLISLDDTGSIPARVRGPDTPAEEKTGLGEDTNPFRLDQSTSSGRKTRSGRVVVEAVPHSRATTPPATEVAAAKTDPPIDTAVEASSTPAPAASRPSTPVVATAPKGLVALRRSGRHQPAADTPSQTGPDANLVSQNSINKEDTVPPDKALETPDAVSTSTPGSVQALRRLTRSNPAPQPGAESSAPNTPTPFVGKSRGGKVAAGPSARDKLRKKGSEPRRKSSRLTRERSSAAQPTSKLEAETASRKLSWEPECSVSEDDSDVDSDLTPLGPSSQGSTRAEKDINPDGFKHLVDHICPEEPGDTREEAVNPDIDTAALDGPDSTSASRISSGSQSALERPPLDHVVEPASEPVFTEAVGTNEGIDPTHDNPPPSAESPVKACPDPLIVEEKEPETGAAESVTEASESERIPEIDVREADPAVAETLVQATAKEQPAIGQTSPNELFEEGDEPIGPVKEAVAPDSTHIGSAEPSNSIPLKSHPTSAEGAVQHELPPEALEQKALNLESLDQPSPDAQSPSDPDQAVVESLLTVSAEAGHSSNVEAEVDEATGSAVTADVTESVIGPVPSQAAAGEREEQEEKEEEEQEQEEIEEEAQVEQDEQDEDIDSVNPDDFPSPTPQVRELPDIVTVDPEYVPVDSGEPPVSHTEPNGSAAVSGVQIPITTDSALDNQPDPTNSVGTSRPSASDQTAFDPNQDVDELAIGIAELENATQDSSTSLQSLTQTALFTDLALGSVDVSGQSTPLTPAPSSQPAYPAHFTPERPLASAIFKSQSPLHPSSAGPTHRAEPWHVAQAIRSFAAPSSSLSSLNSRSATPSGAVSPEAIWNSSAKRQASPAEQPVSLFPGLPVALPDTAIAISDVHPQAVARSTPIGATSNAVASASSAKVQAQQIKSPSASSTLADILIRSAQSLSPIAQLSPPLIAQRGISPPVASTSGSARSRYSSPLSPVPSSQPIPTESVSGISKRARSPASDSEDEDRSKKANKRKKKGKERAVNPDPEPEPGPGLELHADPPSPASVSLVTPALLDTSRFPSPEIAHPAQRNTSLVESTSTGLTDAQSEQLGPTVEQPIQGKAKGKGKSKKNKRASLSEENAGSRRSKRNSTQAPEELAELGYTGRIQVQGSWTTPKTAVTAVNAQARPALGQTVRLGLQPDSGTIDDTGVSSFAVSDRDHDTERPIPRQSVNNLVGPSRYERFNLEFPVLEAQGRSRCSSLTPRGLQNSGENTDRSRFSSIPLVSSETCDYRPDSHPSKSARQLTIERQAKEEEEKRKEIFKREALQIFRSWYATLRRPKPASDGPLGALAPTPDNRYEDRHSGKGSKQQGQTVDKPIDIPDSPVEVLRDPSSSPVLISGLRSRQGNSMARRSNRIIQSPDAAEQANAMQRAGSDSSLSDAPPGSSQVAPTANDPTPPAPAAESKTKITLKIGSKKTPSASPAASPQAPSPALEGADVAQPSKAAKGRKGASGASKRKAPLMGEKPTDGPDRATKRAKAKGVAEEAGGPSMSEDVDMEQETTTITPDATAAGATSSGKAASKGGKKPSTVSSKKAGAGSTTTIGTTADDMIEDALGVSPAAAGSSVSNESALPKRQARGKGKGKARDASADVGATQPSPNVDDPSLAQASPIPVSQPTPVPPPHTDPTPPGSKTASPVPSTAGPSKQSNLAKTALKKSAAAVKGKSRSSPADEDEPVRTPLKKPNGGTSASTGKKGVSASTSAGPVGTPTAQPKSGLGRLASAMNLSSSGTPTAGAAVPARPMAKPSLLAATLAKANVAPVVRDDKKPNNKNGTAGQKPTAVGSMRIPRTGNVQGPTLEEEAEYAKTAEHRARERERRAEWKRSAVNLQAAKDCFKADSVVLPPSGMSNFRYLGRNEGSSDKLMGVLRGLWRQDDEILARRDAAGRDAAGSVPAASSTTTVT